MSAHTRNTLAHTRNHARAKGTVMSAPATICKRQESHVIYKFKECLPVNPHRMSHSPAEELTFHTYAAEQQARACLRAALKHHSNAAQIAAAEHNVSLATATNADTEAAATHRREEIEKRNTDWRLTHRVSNHRSRPPPEASLVYKQLANENRAMDGCVLAFWTYCQCQAGANCWN